ncbi:AAA domain-containing protein [Haloferula helveola]|uniref:AAA domain-containing protein n=1 Tax=Haloferula helveola TaxID=490095 RepID=A0ABN6H7X5_9BACT|nr:AAA domain-containing protein [Haloferula helveola]
MHECHVVCGAPAAGKSTYSRSLAQRLGACLLDSDTLAGRLVTAGMTLAGLDPDDRDSPEYKRAYRLPVYEALFDVARANLSHAPVVICGPFTSEWQREAWPEELRTRLGTDPELHFVWCDEDLRRRRMRERGEARDRQKLADWESFRTGSREDRPVWPHRFIDTGEEDQSCNSR